MEKIHERVDPRHVERGRAAQRVDHLEAQLPRFLGTEDLAQRQRRVVLHDDGNDAELNRDRDRVVGDLHGFLVAAEPRQREALEADTAEEELLARRPHAGGLTRTS